MNTPTMRRKLQQIERALDKVAKLAYEIREQYPHGERVFRALEDEGIPAQVDTSAILDELYLSPLVKPTTKG
jgi:hypothetical protein